MLGMALSRVGQSWLGEERIDFKKLRVWREQKLAVNGIDSAYILEVNVFYFTKKEYPYS